VIERPRFESRRRKRPGGNAVGAAIEAPKAPRRWGEGCAPSSENFSIFSLKIAIFGAFWAAIFTVQRTVLYADHAD